MRASTVYADGLSGGLASDGEGNVGDVLPPPDRFAI